MSYGNKKPRTINLPEVSIYDSAPNRVSVPDLQSIDGGLNSAPVPQGPATKGIGLGAATLITTLASIAANIYQGHQQYKRQKELIDIQHQNAIKDWQMENEYNLPANAKQRLIDAGLNPNLLYGDGSSGAQGGSISPASAPEAFAANPMNGVSQSIMSMQQAQLTDSAIKVNESIANKNNAEAESIPQSIDIQYKKLSLDGQRLYDDIKRNFYLNAESQQGVIESVSRIQTMVHQMALMDSQSAANYSKAALDRVHASTWRFEAAASIEKMLSEANLADWQATKAANDIVDNIMTRTERIANIVANTNESNARTEMINKEFEKLQQEIWIDMPLALRNRKAGESISNNDTGQIGVYILDDAFRIVGQMFGVSLGFGSYHHTGMQVPYPSAPPNPIGFRHP